MANDLTVTFAERFSTTGGEGASEVVAFDGFRYFVTNAAEDRIDVFRDGPGLVGSLELGDLPGYAGLSSVAAKNGFVAVAIDGGDLAGIPQRGHMALFDAATLSLLNYATVGFLPDSIAFSADGSEIYVANEGEPRARGDAPGSVSIVTFPEGFDRLAEVIEVDFTAFDGQEDALREQGVRIFPGVPASRDLEPEYIAVDPADGSILVTLQEANTVARIDRDSLEIALLPQGAVNHAELGNGIDASDRDGEIRIANWPVQGLRMADAIATFEVGGETYYATANEGDSRDFDEARVKDLDLDPTAFPLADALQEDRNLGRLQVSNIDGDVDGDGDYDQLFSYGSRSFTIYDAAGNVVFDSGDDFERLIADIAPERFNTDEPGEADEAENRSDAKGPEPEAIAVGEVDGRLVAVIGLERDSGLMLYDVTDPANAFFLTYIDGVAAGDVAPEVVAFIPGEVSPTGFAQIAIAYEASGTTTVYDLTFTGEQVGDGDPGAGEASDYDLRITELWPGNEPGGNLTADWIEITNFGADPWVRGADPILYYDDESADPSAADPITGVSAIAPGESIVVLIDDESAVAEFAEIWSSAVDLDGVQIGWADGSGLSQGGDGAALFVGGPSDATLADFEEFPDAEANGGQSWNVAAGAFSAPGDGFGSVATTEVNDEEQPAVGSPGANLDAPEIFTLELLHLTDQEPLNVGGTFSDIVNASAVLNALKAQDIGADGEDDATLVLSSGDAIIPGLFYGASEAVFGTAGVGDILIQNALGFQAMALGNHEFDFGTGDLAGLISGDVEFSIGADAQAIFDAAGVSFESFDGTAYPYLSGNLGFGADENLAPLEAADGQAPQPSTVTGSTALMAGGEKIGVVGATTPTLGSISSPGDVAISPSPFGANPTPEQLDALAAIIQADVDALLAANPDMNKVVLLSHMQQIAIEQALAGRLTGVDVIVAGGSNTRLFDGTDRVRDGDTDQGPYPIFVENAGGSTTAIVNTDGSYKYVGRLVIDFNENGEVVPESYDPAISGAYATDEAGVAALGAEGLIDPEIQAIVDAISDAIAAQEGNVFGVSEAFLNGNRSGDIADADDLDGVRTQETNLGNLTADANLAIANEIAAAQGETAPVVFSLKNGGGIRASIGETVVPAGATEPVRQPNPAFFDGDGNLVKPAGGISQNDIATTLAFNNGLTLLTLTGEEIVALLEHGVSGLPGVSGRFPQIGGAKFSFDPDAEAGSRLGNAGLFDEDGALVADLLRDGGLVAPDAEYRVVTLSFLAAPRFNAAGEFIGGGDGYPFPNTNTDPEGVDGDGNPITLEVGDPALVARANVVQLAEDEADPRDGAATFAPDGSEQDALAEYLFDAFNPEEGGAPFGQPDTDRTEDERIQNLAFREDAVFGAQPLVINEILASHTGTDDTEFFEIFGAAGASLAGLSFVAVDAGTGVYETRFDFAEGDALGDNGFFLAGVEQGLLLNYGSTPDRSIEPNTLQNDSATYALVETESLPGGVGDAPSGDEIVLDAVASTQGGGGTFYFDAPVIGPDGSFLPAGVRRVEDGVDTDSTADWTIGDFFLGDANTPTAGGAGEGGGGAGGGDIDDEPTPISAVQGAGDASPLIGRTVVIEAIVTGDFQNGDADEFRDIGGFYVMEEAVDRDGDDSTSEGLFIDDAALSGVDVAEGDRVRVLGVVSEFFGRTQMTAAEIRVEEAGAIGDFDAFAVDSSLPDADEREAVENMLLHLDETFTVTESFDTEQFGELTLSRDGERWNFTQVNAPSVEGFAAHLAERADETIRIDDGADGRRDDYDPIVEPDGDLQSLEGLRLGQDIAPIAAIVDYNFGAYKLRLPAFASFDPVEESNPRPESPAEVGGSFRVAAFNVLNFFTTFGSRGADDADEFERQIDKLITGFLEIDADVVGLVELENNGDAIERLTFELNAAFDDRDYAYVETGVIGSDAITNGFVYDTLTTELVGDAAVLDDAFFLDPLGTGADRNRPAVAQTFREIATEGEFTAVVNHFKSKGSLTGDPRDEDQGDGAGNNDATRTAAAEVLADWLATDPTGAGDEDVVILGDLNAYARETPIAALEAAGYVNTVAAFEGLTQNSYRFSGEIGSLDYALANESLYEQVTGATSWTINSDEQFIFDYNEESTFGAPVLRPKDQNLFDPDSPAKSSDHDPILIGLDLDSDLGETLTVIAAGDGHETAPMFEVIVDGIAQGVRSIETPRTVAERRAEGHLWETFVFTLDDIPAESVEIAFLNDGGWKEGKDVNLHIDAIEIGGRRFESEIDGFYTRSREGAPDSHDGPREAMYWQGALMFDDLAPML